MNKRSERLESNFPPDRAWVSFLAALLTALLVLLSVAYMVLLLQTDITQESRNLEATRELSIVYLATALLLCLLISVLTLSSYLLTGPYAPARRRTQRYWWFSLALVLGVTLLTEIVMHIRLQ